MTYAPSIWCVVPAAGVGKRFGSQTPKQYLTINQQTVMEHSVNRLLQVPQIAGLVIAISEEDQHHKTLHFSQSEKVHFTLGGEERCHSVLHGLQYLSGLADPNDWVLVHDVARPCVRPDDVAKLIEQVSQFDACGGILATPVRDTMKRSDHLNNIVDTVERDRLWHALTPQLFRLGALKVALQKALQDGFLVTDEASAMEHAGEKPILVEGHSDNLKITHPQDLALATLFISQQEGS